jgi:hypothetical protein
MHDRLTGHTDMASLVLSPLQGDDPHRRGKL